MVDDLLYPTAREVASGVVLGQVAGRAVAAAAAAAPTGVGTPLAALERAVLPALTRPPCLVSFSGGLDSSLVLAVAHRVARRDGLPEPIPVSWRFTDAPRADESGWQDRVIRAVGSRTWHLLRADDDLDLVGPVARRMLLRHGVLHPPNAHLHLPIVELAAGGAVLTGAGGDQILAGWRRAGRSGLRTVRRLAALIRSRTRFGPVGEDPFPWLRPDVSGPLWRAHVAQRRAEPVRLGRRIAWHTARRDLALTCSSLARLSGDHDVLLINPLLDDGFLTALRARAGRRRGARRDELLRLITADAFPPVVTAPRPKARFRQVFLRAPTHRFTGGWDGTGVDEDLIEVAGLRAAWSAWPIPPGTAGLVQHLWLTGARRDPAGQPAGDPLPTTYR